MALSSKKNYRVAIDENDQDEGNANKDGNEFQSDEEIEKEADVISVCLTDDDDYFE